MLSLAIDNTNPNSQVSSVPAELTGEGFPAFLQPSPVIDFNSTGATVEAEMIASQAVSAIPFAFQGTVSTGLAPHAWSPWSVCKGSI